MRSIDTLMAEGKAKPARPRPGALGRRLRPARVFDADGNEVFITLTCPHCGATRPLAQFGLRKMGNGQIRNAPWCRPCRSSPGVPIRIVVQEGPAHAA
jgi:hypothetical protein